MSVKFNSLGQWTLVGDGGTQLIKGIKPAGQEVSTRFAKTEGQTGKDVVAKALATGDMPDMVPRHRQPTDQELFGHLVPTQEQVQKAEDEWENRFQKHFDLLKKPVDDQNSNENKEWGTGKSFNSTLTQEELAKRAGFIGKDEDDI